MPQGFFRSQWYGDFFFFKWFPTSRSWLVFLRPIFRDDFFLFRIIFTGISYHYSKNRLLEGDFATCPQPFGLSPGAAIRPPTPGVWPSTPGGCPQPRGLPSAPGGSPQPPGAAPSPRFSGVWGWGLPQPPSPRGLRQSPVFGGSPQKSQPPRKIVCVWGGFLEILLFRRSK